MAAGKNISAKSISSANILDVAPTVLYLLGQPIPEDMDGAIIKDMFSEEFLRMNPPIYGEAADSNEAVEAVSYSSDEEQEVRERLKGLGYIE
jgi:arylsulfatase A-like enzyme